MRREPILIIGEAPGPNGDADATLEGACGRRLAEYAGLAWDEYLVRTERHNLLQYHPDGTWPDAEARAAAQLIFPSLLGRRSLLLGQSVARAFGMRASELTWVRMGDQEVAIVPHPSGLNRWWNDPVNRTRARQFLASAFGTGTP